MSLCMTNVQGPDSFICDKEIKLESLKTEELPVVQQKIGGEEGRSRGEIWGSSQR